MPAKCTLDCASQWEMVRCDNIELGRGRESTAPLRVRVQRNLCA
jgi:hypothetical protein